MERNFYSQLQPYLTVQPVLLYQRSMCQDCIYNQEQRMDMEKQLNYLLSHMVLLVHKPLLQQKLF